MTTTLTGCAPLRVAIMVLIAAAQVDEATGKPSTVICKKKQISRPNSESFVKTEGLLPMEAGKATGIPLSYMPLVAYKVNCGQSAFDDFTSACTLFSLSATTTTEPIILSPVEASTLAVPETATDSIRKKTSEKFEIPEKSGLKRSCTFVCYAKTPAVLNCDG